MTTRVARSQERKSKRLKVRFGVDEISKIAFLGNASVAGAWIITAQPERVGTLLRLCFYLPDGEEVLVRGQVRWAKKISPNLIRLSKNAGMGIKFTRFESGLAIFSDYLATLRY
jgi:Tfp pilus assembly protein PilZ